MSDNKFEKIKHRKAEILIKHQSIPNEIIIIDGNEQFTQLIKDFPDKIVVIDFWATWCAPCKRYAPIFAKVSREFSMDYIFAKINADENPDIAQFFGVTSIPTTLLTKGNNILRKFAGAINFETLKHILETFKPKT